MSSSLPIHSVLNSSNFKTFHVPPYQRDYSWDKQQFEDLLEDIQDLEISDDNKLLNRHFIWLLVLIRREEAGEYDVVDGQQRLTTVMILLSAIRDHFVALKKGMTSEESVQLSERVSNRISQINNLIFIDSAEDIKRRRLIPNENDKEYFEMVTFNLDGENANLSKPDPRTMQYTQSFQTKSPWDVKNEYAKERCDGRVLRWKKAFKAYETFFGSLQKELSNKKSIRDKIGYLESMKLRVEQGLEVMIFASENDSDAFNLFETLNDRWLELASIDLVRNKILQTLPNERRKEAAALLDETFGTNGDLFWANPNTFLKYYYSSRKSYIMKSELYSEWKKWIEKLKDDESGIFDLIGDIKLAGESYSYFKNNRHPDGNLAELFAILDKTQSIQWFSVGFPIMKIFAKFEGNQDIRKKTYDLFWLLANITIRFILREERFNHLEKEFPKLAQRLDRVFSDWLPADAVLKEMEAVGKELKSLMDEKVPDFGWDDITNLINRDYGNNLAAALLRIYYAANVNAHNDYSWELTLEHVCPESHMKFWSSHNAQIDDIKYKLGNMLLVSPKFNPKLSNKSFELKKAEYILRRVKDIPDADVNYAWIKTQNDWDAVHVAERSERLLRGSAPGWALWIVAILNNKDMPFLNQ